MTLLIDDRPGGPPPGPAPVEPNWRVWAWLAAAAVLVFGAANAGGVVSWLLVCATVYAVCRAVTTALDYAGGLTEWRQ